MTIKFKTKVRNIEQKVRIVRTWKDENGDVGSEVESEGWFMTLDGLWLSMWVGDEEPKTIRPGDNVDIYVCPENALVVGRQ